MGVASQRTFQAMNSNLTVLGGGTVRVLKLIVSNDSATQQLLSLDYADSSGTYAKVVAPGNKTEVVEVDFLADFGLLIPSVGAANLYVTVFHGAAGS